MTEFDKDTVILIGSEPNPALMRLTQPPEPLRYSSPWPWIFAIAGSVCFLWTAIFFIVRWEFS